MSKPDLLERLRIESDRFARVPKYDKFWLAPEVHARLADLWREAADEIASHQLFGDPEQLHTLKRERDEARRWFCDLHHIGNGANARSGSRETAKAHGWDCFEKENHNA